MKKTKALSMVRMGGYIYWDWKFPFIHRKEETMYIGTDFGLYKYKNGKYENIGSF